MAETPDIVRGQVRRVGYRRVSHGLYVADTPGTPRSRHLEDLAAYVAVLPAGAAFTHITAAGLREWATPAMPSLTPVFAAGPASSHPRRAGLTYSRLCGLGEPAMVDGLPVVSAAETLLRAARDLALLDLVAMLDSALNLGHVTPDDLAPLMATSRPGARRLRQAHAWSDGRSESAYESLLRLFHEFADVPVQPQLVIRDDAGRELARADLWVVGTSVVHEYDGEEHGRRPQRVRDLRRQRLLSEHGLERQGFVAEDLFQHPVALLQELDRVLGRPHRSSRLRRWRREVELSSYSLTGRQRLLNRWLAYPGFNDWAKTA